METQNKILTVIVPSYNMEAYLPKCLGSLIIDDKELLQTLEVIVVNDGSKDSTSEIAHAFEAKYPAVFKVIDKVNGHYGSCVNVALPLAMGMYVRLLDADDYVVTSTFEEYLRTVVIISASKIQPDMIIADYNQVGVNGDVIKYVHYGFPEGTFFSPDQSVQYNTQYIGIHALAYRTSLLHNIAYRQLEGVPYTDTQFALSAIGEVDHMYYFPHAITCYLLGRDGQTMDARVFVDKLDTYVQIAQCIIRTYVDSIRNVSHNATQYYKYYVERLAKECIDYYTLGYNGLLPISNGKDFDLFLRNLMPDYYSSLSKLMLSRFVRFHYIKEWRRFYSNQTLKFRLYRMYVKFVTVLIVFIRKCIKGTVNG